MIDWMTADVAVVATLLSARGTATADAQRAPKAKTSTKITIRRSELLSIRQDYLEALARAAASRSRICAPRTTFITP